MLMNDFLKKFRGEENGRTDCVRRPPVRQYLFYEKKETGSSRARVAGG